MTKVFVYGTLKRGNHNFKFLANSRFLGAHTTDPSYTLTCNGFFPKAVRGGSTAIVGEVFEVDEKTLESLNRLEGFHGFGSPHNHYDVDLIETPFGETMIYVVNPGEGSKTVVPSGEWIPSY